MGAHERSARRPPTPQQTHGRQQRLPEVDEARDARREDECVPEHDEGHREDAHAVERREGAAALAPHRDEAAAARDEVEAGEHGGPEGARGRADLGGAPLLLTANRARRRGGEEGPQSRCSAGEPDDDDQGHRRVCACRREERTSGGVSDKDCNDPIHCHHRSIARPSLNH